MTRYMLLCVFCILAACSAAPDQDHPVGNQTNAIIIPVLPADETFVVPVHINGEGPFRFLIDTGATASALFNGLPDELGLDPPQGQRDALVRGLTSSERRPIVDITDLSLGGQTHQRVRAVVLPRSRIGSDVQGIIGMDILKDYAFGFDPDLGNVILVPAADFDPAPLAGWHEVPLTANPYGGRDFGLHFAEGTFAGKKVPILIDTGTMPSVMNWEAASYSRTLRKIRSDLRQKWQVEGAVGSFSPRVLANMPTIYLGSHPWQRPILLVLELHPLEILGGTGEPLVIAGADVMSVREFVMDFSSDRMFINPWTVGEQPLPNGIRRGAASGDDRY